MISSVTVTSLDILYHVVSKPVHVPWSSASNSTKYRLLDSFKNNNYHVNFKKTDIRYRSSIHEVEGSRFCFLRARNTKAQIAMIQISTVQTELYYYTFTKWLKFKFWYKHNISSMYGRLQTAPPILQRNHQKREVLYGMTHLRTWWGVRRDALISNICSSRTKCDFQMLIMLASMAQPEGP